MTASTMPCSSGVRRGLRRHRASPARAGRASGQHRNQIGGGDAARRRLCGGRGHGDRAHAATLEDILNKGVPLNFLLEFELIRPRWYWLNEKVVTQAQPYKLSYNTLTRQYRISLGTIYQNFETLSEALRFISRPRNVPVADKAMLQPGTTYSGLVAHAPRRLAAAATVPDQRARLARVEPELRLVSVYGVAVTHALRTDHRHGCRDRCATRLLVCIGLSAVALYLLFDGDGEYGAVHQVLSGAARGQWRARRDSRAAGDLPARALGQTAAPARVRIAIGAAFRARARVDVVAARRIGLCRLGEVSRALDRFVVRGARWTRRSKAGSNLGRGALDNALKDVAKQADAIADALVAPAGARAGLALEPAARTGGRAGSRAVHQSRPHRFLRGQRESAGFVPEALSPGGIARRRAARSGLPASSPTEERGLYLRVVVPVGVAVVDR